MLYSRWLDNHSHKQPGLLTFVVVNVVSWFENGAGPRALQNYWSWRRHYWSWRSRMCVLMEDTVENYKMDKRSSYHTGSACGGGGIESGTH
jgi:hypothetical protein